MAINWKGPEGSERKWKEEVKGRSERKWKEEVKGRSEGKWKEEVKRDRQARLQCQVCVDYTVFPFLMIVSMEFLHMLITYLQFKHST